MNTIKLLLIFVILTGTILPSCRKGEGDPFLTLRSRKARITGEWKMDSRTSSYTYNNIRF